jgi:hypothetical protein
MKPGSSGTSSYFIRSNSRTAKNGATILLCRRAFHDLLFAQTTQSKSRHAAIVEPAFHGGKRSVTCLHTSHYPVSQKACQTANVYKSVKISCHRAVMHFALQTINYQMPADDYGSADGMAPQQPEGPHQELMQTESENRLLRHRLNTTQDQATGIEASLAEVAQLTEFFTQQVMSQSEQIETLYDEVSAERLLISARQMAGMWRCCCISETVHAVPTYAWSKYSWCTRIEPHHSMCNIASEAACPNQVPPFHLLGQTLSRTIPG